MKDNLLINRVVISIIYPLKTSTVQMTCIRSVEKRRWASEASLRGQLENAIGIIFAKVPY